MTVSDVNCIALFHFCVPSLSHPRWCYIVHFIAYTASNQDILFVFGHVAFLIEYPFEVVDIVSPDEVAGQRVVCIDFPSVLVGNTLVGFASTTGLFLNDHTLNQVEVDFVLPISSIGSSSINEGLQSFII